MSFLIINILTCENWPPVQGQSGYYCHALWFISLTTATALNQMICFLRNLQIEKKWITKTVVLDNRQSKKICRKRYSICNNSKTFNFCKCFLSQLSQFSPFGRLCPARLTDHPYTVVHVCGSFILVFDESLPLLSTIIPLPSKWTNEQNRTRDMEQNLSLIHISEPTRH